jgi:hypothetical protein
MMDVERSNIQCLVDSHVCMLLQEVIQRANERSQTDKVSRALLYLLVRVSNTWRSIETLWHNMPDGDGFIVDTGVLLRAMFDAYLQAQYIVHDPCDQGKRARDYLDFEIVERYKIAKKLIAHDSPLSNRLKGSPKLATSEKELVAEYERVKGRYPDGKRKTKTRNTWYPGNLAALAHSIGKEVEYDFFVATLHGCVHSSAHAVQKGPPISPQNALHWASKFAACVARVNVQYNRFVLSDFQQELLQTLCKDYAEIACDGKSEDESNHVSRRS